MYGLFFLFFVVFVVVFLKKWGSFLRGSLMNESECSMNESECSMNESECSMDESECSMDESECSMNESEAHYHSLSPHGGNLSGFPPRFTYCLPEFADVQLSQHTMHVGTSIRSPNPTGT